MLRTTYIIKPRLQIKYLIVSLIVVGLTACVVYYAFWSSLIRSAGLEQLSAGEWKALERGYQSSFVYVVLILGFAIALESIFLFHRLVGPVFVFERMIRRLAGGDFSVRVHLRKHDELKDLAGEIQTMVNNVRTNVEGDRDKINEIRRDIDQGKLAEAKAKLATLTTWCTTEQPAAPASTDNTDTAA